jgi:hypothetical protein
MRTSHADTYQAWPVANPSALFLAGACIGVARVVLKSASEGTHWGSVTICRSVREISVSKSEIKLVQVLVREVIVPAGWALGSIDPRPCVVVHQRHTAFKSLGAGPCPAPEVRNLRKVARPMGAQGFGGV